MFKCASSDWRKRKRGAQRSRVSKNQFTCSKKDFAHINAVANDGPWSEPKGPLLADYGADNKGLAQ